jgi:hypothetical protein
VEFGNRSFEVEFRSMHWHYVIMSKVWLNFCVVYCAWLCVGSCVYCAGMEKVGEVPPSNHDVVCTGPFYFPNAINDNNLSAMYLVVNIRTGGLMLRYYFTDGVYLIFESRRSPMVEGSIVCKVGGCCVFVYIYCYFN